MIGIVGVMRRLGEHDTATCERMISRRTFPSRQEAEQWITRTSGRNYIHQIRPASPALAAGGYEVKYCDRDAAVSPPRWFR